MKDMNWPERVAYLENQLADSDRDNRRLREFIEGLPDGDEIVRLRGLHGLLSEAREYITAYQLQCDTVGGLPHATDLAARIDAALEGAPVQPNGATGWIDNAVTPPGESVERVLVAYPTGLVETTQAHYVRLYPTNYPWWMPLPVAPAPTPQPQPDAVASTFADCETAMGMEYTTPPCACAEYYPGLPHHPDCPTRNADQQEGAQSVGG